MNKNKPTDPFEIKKLSKLHPYRLLWTAYSRFIDLYGKVTFQSISELISHHQPVHILSSAGDPVTDTAHPSN